jgi:hypothetical protein
MVWNGTKTETVETVSDRTDDLDHRAEAAVLMRSLRVLHNELVYVRLDWFIGD